MLAVDVDSEYDSDGSDIFHQHYIPFQATLASPKAIRDPDNKDCVLISSHYQDVVKGIYRINLETNESECLYEYDEWFRPNYHSHFIDSINKMIYIFGGDFQVFGSLNLNTKCMKILSKQNVLANEKRTSLITIPSINQIHIFSDFNHYRYEINKKIVDVHDKFLNAKLTTDNIMKGDAKLIYDSMRSQLIICGSHHNQEIWTCSFDAKSVQFKWNLMSIKMPFQVDCAEYDVILGFKNCIFVFYFPDSGFNDIYVIDLIKNELYISDYCVPSYIDSPFNIHVIKNGNHAHILDTYDGCNVKVDLYDIIPHQMIQSHRNYHKPLVVGYLKKEEKELNIQYIPIPLKMLILTFLPL